MRDSKRDTDVKNRFWTLWEKARMGWFERKNIETCILPYVKQIASPGSMHETGCSGLVHWDEPEGWDGERGGKRVQDGDTCTPMADSCECMAKTTTIL